MTCGNNLVNRSYFRSSAQWRGRFLRRRQNGGAQGCQRKRRRAATDKLNNNDGIVTVSVRTSHVFIGVPIVFPPNLIDEIAELIFSSRLEFERDSIISTLELFHRMRVNTPIVEIADKTDTLCIRCSDSWQSERHLTCLFLVRVLLDEACPNYSLWCDCRLLTNRLSRDDFLWLFSFFSFRHGHLLSEEE